MTLKTRRALFYGLTLLFLIIGTSVVFYSSGWRFDFETLTINRLGALYFRIHPEQTTIAIEKTPYQFNPGLLRSGLLIANLFPKTYTVKITKDGYQPWIKELRVRPSLVTEVAPIVLLPEKIDLGEPIAEGISDFWSGPKYFITKKEGGGLYLNNKEKIIGDRLIRWSKNGNAAITALNYRYFYINLQKPAGALNVSLIFDSLRGAEDSSPINQIYFDSADDQILTLNANGQRYWLDIKKYLLTPVAEPENITDQDKFTSPDNAKLAFINEAKELTVYDLSGESGRTEILRLPVGAAEKSAVQWHANSNYLFIKYPNSLYLLEASGLAPINLQIIASGVQKYGYQPESNIYLLKNSALYQISL